MGKDANLTPEQRIAKLEESLAAATEAAKTAAALAEKVTALEAKNEELEAKLTEQAKEREKEDPPEPKVEDKKDEPKDEERRDAVAAQLHPSLTKEDVSAAVADATRGLTEEVASLKTEIAELKGGKDEAASTKQPGGEETIVPGEAGATGERDGKGDTYADAFAGNEAIAKVNTEGCSYEQICARDDDYALRVLATAQRELGTEEDFAKKLSA